MHVLKRYRTALSWAAGIAVAASIAVGGATTVLAEGPACTVDGRAISQEEAAADPTLCPDQNGAAATTSAPADTPTNTTDAPAQTTPAPTPPVSDDDATDPAAPPTTDGGDATAASGTTTPTDTPPADTTSTAPTTSTPATEPAAPAPEQPAVETATEPAATPPAADPAVSAPTAATPATTAPVSQPTPHPVHHPRAASPTHTAAPTPAKVTPAPTTRTQVIAAKHYAVTFQDARLFREHYTPKGRIPEQPQLSAKQVGVFATAAANTGTAWTTLAAIAWTQNEWKGLDAQALRAAAVFLGTSDANNAEGALRSYLARTGDASKAHPTQVMADYFAAMGRGALLHGLDDSDVREQLQRSVLTDDRITLYDGGRSDVKDGLIDPRVLVTIRFLANRFHTVSISALVSGHGVYTASGNVSLHALGQAVDVASLDGEIINAATQRKGGNTYHAVQDVLLLPKAMQPKELISLWAMGGASFALPDHNDHMHVGFATETDDAGTDD